jgi:hypothetical protein
MSSGRFKCEHIYIYLTLNVRDSIGRETELVQGNLGLLQISQEPKFTLKEKEKTFSNLSCTGCTTYSVNVIAWIIWWIELNNPIDSWYIESPSSNICTKENAGLCVHELEKRVRSLLLLLFALGGLVNR